GMAAPRALFSARNGQRADGTRRLRHVRRVLLHAGDRPRLGALRAVASAGWRVGGATDPTRRVGPVRHDADAAVSRRDLRRALVARAQARTWWWHAGGRAPARRR